MINLDDVPEPPAFPSARWDADIRMLAAVTDGTGARAANVRWKRRIVVASASTALLLGSGGVAVALVHRAAQLASVQNIGRCYVEASSDFTEGFPGSSVSNASSNTGEEGSAVPSTLMDECATLWRLGVLQADQSRRDAVPGTNFPVPDLVACVLPNGQAAIFPGNSSTCAGLGLPPLAR